MSNDLWRISATVNGKPVEADVNPTHTLARILREQLHLTGTKVCCEEGECGACTVLLNGKTVNSCLMLGVEIDGAELVTIEGLAPAADQLDPVQKAFIAHGSVQCGYCTPGMLMSAKGLLMRNPDPTVPEIKEALEGNLCRCTGYERIIKAVQAAAKES